ncbi:Putative cytochrome P450, Wax synthase domain, cytochrome P450 superfamily [Colletotrichum destructivum]|uniref:Cytochrome P450, Wax synthase domain, cytochrome P450 superfamily n=1 Tax=Colletotrichum destructivum TaxID=34406 RepID=A0AAX4IXV2_9PEZI|nr:Putative cytochrome P450, Wax synthase domain, cytochrome P450 superfamily [Colletotrichum destructivum]
MSASYFSDGALATGAAQIAFLAAFLSIIILIPTQKDTARLMGVLILALLTYGLQIAVCGWCANPHWRSAAVPLFWIQFMSASELILVRKWAGTERSDAATKETAENASSLPSQVRRSLSLLWSLRRIGTEWQVKHTPGNGALQSGGTHDRLSFISKRLITTLAAYLVLSTMSQAPSPDPSLISSRKQALLQGVVDLSPDDVTFRIIGTISFWICTALINLVMYNSACLAFAFLGLSDPDDCPPLYGSLISSYSIRRFWGVTWHQCLRSGLAGHADMIANLAFPFRQRMVSRYLRLFIAFLLSGMIHHSSDIAMGIAPQEAGSLRFFLLQPVGIILEDSIQGVACRWPALQLPHTFKVSLGYLWTLAFLAWSTPTWFYPQQRLGIDSSGLLPFHPILQLITILFTSPITTLIARSSFNYIYRLNMAEKIGFEIIKPVAVLLSPAFTAVVVTCTFLYYIYLKGLPKPLAGIPYNESAVGKFMGDLSEFQHARTHGEGFTVWMRDLASRHNSPLVQVFLGPFSAPALVLFDYRESYDIVARRTKEFDRCQRDAETMATILPEHHLSMMSADPRFKGNKELVKDLMTPWFLHESSAPEIHKNAISLVQLWNLKAKWALDHPFDAHRDLQNSALDIIMAAAFGQADGNSVLWQHITQEAGHRPVTVPSNQVEPVIFRNLGLPADYQATVDITHFMGRVVTSPFPTQQAWLLKKFTKVGNVFTAKDQFIKSQIQKAVSRLDGNVSAKDKVAKSALDYIVLREVAAANKAGCKPTLDSKRIEDEKKVENGGLTFEKLLGYLVAGHETSASILSWTVKFLADNQKHQDTLRKHIQAVYANAFLERRPPNEVELTKMSAPYLDAFLEEVLRLARTASILTRQAIADTTILGHFVPKGTNLFLFTQGASYVKPALDVDENSRSKTSQGARMVREWPVNDVGEFRPERWLVSRSGKEVLDEELLHSTQDWALFGFEFNPQAGPMLTFGGGPRGCFGKRLAYMELRMVVALLVWNFQFKPCADELSTYDLRETITVEPKSCFVRLQKLE